MRRKLKRSPTNRVVGGVCGGLAEHFNVSPDLLRIPFMLFGMTVLYLPYFLLWIVLPLDEDGSAASKCLRESVEKKSLSFQEAVRRWKKEMYRTVSQWDPDEEVLWGYEELDTAPYGSQELPRAVAFTNKRVRVRRWGKDPIDLSYEKIECLQHNLTYPYQSRGTERHRIFLYCRHHKKEEIGCDADLPSGVLANCLNKRCGKRKNDNETSRADTDNVLKELIKGMESDFSARSHAFFKGGYYRNLSKRLQSRFVANLSHTRLLKLQDPLLLFDDWLVEIVLNKTGIPGVLQTTLLKRSDIRFALYRRYFVLEQHYGGSQGPHDSEKEIESALHIYTPAKEYIFTNLNYRKLKPYLDSLNPL